MFLESCNLNLEIFKKTMSVDISKYVDVSNERRSPVWNHMLLNKEKGEALCKLCLDKKVTRTVYAKNGSTKIILDHFRLIHGIGKKCRFS